jgi:hypothetical protein
MFVNMNSSMTMRPTRTGLGKAALVASILAATGLATYQANAATATANGTATVMTPIAITTDADLDFGAFSALTGGTVAIDSAGTRSATGSVVLSSSEAGGAASFTVTGQADATYTITLPSTATITHSVDDTQTMTIDSFTSNPGTTGTLTAGTQTLAVGGTLTVASAQMAGSYTGTFDVSVEYN